MGNNELLKCRRRASFLSRLPEFGRQPAELSRLPGSGIWDVTCPHGSGTCHLHDGWLQLKKNFFWSCKGSSWRRCSLLTLKRLRLESTTYLGNPLPHLLTPASQGSQDGKWGSLLTASGNTILFFQQSRHPKRKKYQVLGSSVGGFWISVLNNKLVYSLALKILTIKKCHVVYHAWYLHGVTPCLHCESWSSCALSHPSCSHQVLWRHSLIPSWHKQRSPMFSPCRCVGLDCQSLDLVPTEVVLWVSFHLKGGTSEISGAALFCFIKTLIEILDM